MYTEYVCKRFEENALAVWSTYIVVLSPPATEETGAMDREVESRQYK
jgi:hypothetical protein